MLECLMADFRLEESRTKMSELLQRLAAMAPGETLDWRKVREEIHDEHDRELRPPSALPCLRYMKP